MAASAQVATCQDEPVHPRFQNLAVRSCRFCISNHWVAGQLAEEFWKNKKNQWAAGAVTKDKDVQKTCEEKLQVGCALHYPGPQGAQVPMLGLIDAASLVVLQYGLEWTITIEIKHIPHCHQPQGNFSQLGPFGRTERVGLGQTESQKDSPRFFFQNLHPAITNCPAWSLKWCFSHLHPRFPAAMSILFTNTSKLPLPKKQG